MFMYFHNHALKSNLNIPLMKPGNSPILWNEVKNNFTSLQYKNMKQKLTALASTKHTLKMVKYMKGKCEFKDKVITRNLRTLTSEGLNVRQES